MKQTHKLVPIEPTALQVRAGQLGVTTTCAKAIYAAMLASAPEVGEAVSISGIYQMAIVYLNTVTSHNKPSRKFVN